MAFVYRVYRPCADGSLIQITSTCGSLDSAKTFIETTVNVASYEEADDGQVYALVNGQRTYRIEPVPLR